MAKFVNSKVYTPLEFAKEYIPYYKDAPAFLFYDDFIIRSIEIAGRTCYNSFKNVNSSSDISFYKNLIKRKHDPVLEFGYAILEVSNNICNYILASGFKFLNISKESNRILVSGSIRAWRDFIKFKSAHKPVREYILYILKNTENFIDLFVDIEYDRDTKIFNENYLAKVIQSTELKTIEEKLKHKYYHFVWISDRGVMAEITRHRICSFAVQSTRYVNYKTGVEFIIPEWAKDKPRSIWKWFKLQLRISEWKQSCKESEKRYRRQIKFGSKPQEARQSLNHSTKTIINISANLEEWLHIFKMRSSQGAHPDIRRLSNMTREIVLKDISFNEMSSLNIKESKKKIIKDAKNEYYK